MAVIVSFHFRLLCWHGAALKPGKGIEESHFQPPFLGHDCGDYRPADHSPMLIIIAPSSSKEEESRLHPDQTYPLCRVRWFDRFSDHLPFAFILDEDTDMSLVTCFISIWVDSSEGLVPNVENVGLQNRQAWTSSSLCRTAGFPWYISRTCPIVCAKHLK